MIKIKKFLSKWTILPTKTSFTTWRNQNIWYKQNWWIFSQYVCETTPNQWENVLTVPSVVYIYSSTPRIWRTTTQAHAIQEVPGTALIIEFFLQFVAVEWILVVFIIFKENQQMRTHAKHMMENERTTPRAASGVTLFFRWFPGNERQERQGCSVRPRRREPSRRPMRVQLVKLGVNRLGPDRQAQFQQPVKHKISTLLHWTLKGPLCLTEPSTFTTNLRNIRWSWCQGEYQTCIECTQDTVKKVGAKFDVSERFHTINFNKCQHIVLLEAGRTRKGLEWCWNGYLDEIV